MAEPNPTQTSNDAGRPTPRFTFDGALGALALIAAFVVTASGEFTLARAAEFPTYVAPAVPAALDIYALRALRARRDVAIVVIAMVATNAVAHLVTAGVIRPGIPVLIGTAAIAPMVWWRIHGLDRPRARTAARPTPAAAPPVAPPTPPAAPVHGPAPQPTPEEVIRGLFVTLGRRPETREMTGALRDAGHGRSGGYARALRSRVEAAMAAEQTAASEPEGVSDAVA